MKCLDLTPISAANVRLRSAVLKRIVGDNGCDLLYPLSSRVEEGPEG